MEWPYQSLRRTSAAARRAAINVAEYNFVDRPYGNNPDFAKYKKLSSYAGNTFTHNWVVNEKEHPTTGTPYAWVRARMLGGKTNFWGRGALRYGPLEFKAASLDGFDVDWPIDYNDVKPYYDKVDVLLGLLGHQGKPDAGAGRHLPAADRSSIAWRSSSSARSRRWAGTYIPGRAGVTTEGVLNKSTARGAWGAAAAAAAAISNASFHSPTALIYPARDTGNVTVRPYSIVREVLLDESTNKASRRPRDRHEHAEVMDFTARVVVLGAGCPRHHAHPVELEVGALPERDGQFVRRARPLSERAHDGHPRLRLHPHPHRHRRRPSTTRGRWRRTCRASATSTDKHPDFIRGYHFQGGGGARRVSRRWRTRFRASARRSSRACGSTIRR